MEKNYSAADLRRVFSYDPATGEIRWKSSPRLNVAAGSVAGCTTSKGYVIVRYRLFGFKAHRLAWLLHYGKWPEEQIDHINMVRDDNRIENLREASNGENKWNSRAQRNNSHGIKGVTWDHLKGRWVARIGCGGRRILVGRFQTQEQAAAAYAEAARKLAGEFARC